MVPSGIRRENNKPYRTTTAANGMIIVEDAYEGFYDLSNDIRDRVDIKGVRLRERPTAASNSQSETDE